MTVYEIPLSGANQTFPITLGTTEYRLTFVYRKATDAGWIMDIADTEGVAIVSGISLVTGADLLAQYAYLGIGGSLYVTTDGDADAVPTFDNLGSTAHLYWVPN